MNKADKIYVAGHNGLVGSAICRLLQSRGFSNIVTRTHQELDLTRQEAVECFFDRERPDYVFLAAARVGGIGANARYPAQFLYVNLAIGLNVVQAAWRSKVQLLVNLGSSCVYPKLAPQPLREDALLTGPLEPTNEAYAIAKIAVLKQCQFYNAEHGTRFLSLVPTNLYGPNDSFDFNDSHVLPAVMRKLHLGRLLMEGNLRSIQQDLAYWSVDHAFLSITTSEIEGLLEAHGICRGKVVLWGTGKPKREFLHVDDLAAACLFLVEKRARENHLVNVGCGSDLRVAELAVQIAEVVEYRGQVTFDGTKPDGTPRKLLDVSLLNSLGWGPTIGLRQGIEDTYRWYQHQVKDS